MRPSTVSRPLFYSCASNSHAGVRETTEVHLLSSGLEAQRQQLDLTSQRQQDTRPRDGTSQGGFGWSLHRVSLVHPGFWGRQPVLAQA